MNNSTLWLCCFVIMILTYHDGDARRVSSDEEKKKRASMVQRLMDKYKQREGHVRLVGGANKYEGNVEIVHNGKWGAVCDDEWDEAECDVVCKQLGYGMCTKRTQASQFGLATRKYWMDNTFCDGTENTLGECRFDGWGLSDCVPEEAAGVECAPEGVYRAVADDNFASSAPARTLLPKRRLNETLAGEGVRLRLGGGRSHDEGRLEVWKSGRWGGVCGDGWSIREAMVVCRSLGLGYATDAYKGDFFGNVTEMVLSGVHCDSTEDTLDQCLHDDLGDVECPGVKTHAAGVACAEEMADLVFDHVELMRTAHLEDRQLMMLQCAMEENCVASQAYAVKRDREEWLSETRRLLRFTVSAFNRGTADFRPAIPKHMWEWHMCHMHYHSMEVFATFDILDYRGVRVAEGHKASFCLEDNTCSPGVTPKYNCANYGDQGVSVNCSDIYKYNIDCQWIDITELTPGDYTIRVAVNPEMKVPEMSYENNAASCKLLYTELFATVYDCRLHLP